MYTLISLYERYLQTYADITDNYVGMGESENELYVWEEIMTDAYGKTAIQPLLELNISDPKRTQTFGEIFSGMEAIFGSEPMVRPMLIATR